MTNSVSFPTVLKTMSPGLSRPIQPNGALRFGVSDTLEADHARRTLEATGDTIVETLNQLDAADEDYSAHVAQILGQANQPLKNYVLIQATGTEDNPKLIQALVEAGADVNASHPNQPSPLYHAALEEKTGNFAILLKLGGDIHSEYDRSTIMMLAAKAYSSQMLVKLLAAVPDSELGTFINKPNPWGKTALMEAADAGRLTNVMLLTDHGANIDQQDSMGNTALMYAVSYRSDEDKYTGDYNEVARFLAHRTFAKNNLKNNSGQNALHVAAKSMRWDAVEDLAFAMRERWSSFMNEESGINEKDNFGKTPLDYAKENAFYTEGEKAVKVMKRWGAVSAKDVGKPEKWYQNILNSIGL